jgi:hypothetical protein
MRGGMTVRLPVAAPYHSTGRRAPFVLQPHLFFGVGFPPAGRGWVGSPRRMEDGVVLEADEAARHPQDHDRQRGHQAPATRPAAGTVGKGRATKCGCTVRRGTRIIGPAGSAPTGTRRQSRRRPHPNVTGRRCPGWSPGAGRCFDWYLPSRAALAFFTVVACRSCRRGARPGAPRAFAGRGDRQGGPRCVHRGPGRRWRERLTPGAAGRGFRPGRAARDR